MLTDDISTIVYLTGTNCTPKIMITGLKLRINERIILNAGKQEQISTRTIAGVRSVSLNLLRYFRYRLLDCLTTSVALQQTVVINSTSHCTAKQN